MKKAIVLGLGLFAAGWMLVAGMSATSAVDRPSVSGACFNLDGKAKGKLQRGGSGNGEVSGQICFGPREGLAANEFLITLQDTGDFLGEFDVGGTYTVDDRGCVLLTINADDLEDEIEDLIEEVIEDVFARIVCPVLERQGLNCEDFLELIDFDLEIKEVKSKVCPKAGRDGDVIRVATSIKFCVIIGNETLNVTFRGGFAYKAGGGRQA